MKVKCHVCGGTGRVERKKPYEYWTDADVTHAVLLRQSGKTWKEIARTLIKYTPNAVRSRVERELGIRPWRVK